MYLIRFLGELYHFMLKKTSITDSSRNIFLFVWTDLVQFLVQFFSKLGTDPVNGGLIMVFFAGVRIQIRFFGEGGFETVI